MKKITRYVTSIGTKENFNLKTFKTVKKAKNYLKFYKNSVTEIYKETDTKSCEICSLYYRNY